MQEGQQVLSKGDILNPRSMVELRHQNLKKAKFHVKPVQGYLFYQHLMDLNFVQEIWIFGSRARNDHQDRADVDLALSCPEALENDWNTVLEIIENADTLLKIDCVRLDTLDEASELKKNILTQGIKLYDKR